MAYLQVAKPCWAVQGTLFLLVVEGVDVVPARILVVFSLNALVGQVIKV